MYKSYKKFKVLNIEETIDEVEVFKTSDKNESFMFVLPTNYEFENVKRLLNDFFVSKDENNYLEDILGNLRLMNFKPGSFICNSNVGLLMTHKFKYNKPNYNVLQECLKELRDYIDTNKNDKLETIYLFIDPLEISLVQSQIFNKINKVFRSLENVSLVIVSENY